MRLNYQTLAFVMDIPAAEAKEMFKHLLNQDTITTKDTILDSEFKGMFGKIRSVDARYDGSDKFLFYLQQRKESYRKYLNEKSCIKNKKFTGKFKFFYDVLTNEQIEFCHDVLSQKHKFIYGSKRNAANS